MANRISYSTLADQPQQNIYDLLNTRSKVADPVDPSGKRKFLYTREPDVNATGFQGFPYVIVPGTSFTPSKQTVNRKSAQQDFSCDIEVVTCDRGRGAGDAQGFAQLNSITNAILQTLLDNTNRNALRLNGLLFSNPQSGKSTVEAFKDTLVYRRTIVQSFKTRMPVSA